MKSQRQLESFVAYCNEHPEERFWQALRNWCGWSFVLVCMIPQWTTREVTDTFYWEGRKGPTRSDL